MRALQGESDAEIAQAMHMSESGVKNWWRAIYKRAEQRHPALFAGLGRGEEGRGQERRRVLLNYVREREPISRLSMRREPGEPPAPDDVINCMSLKGSS